MIHSGFVIENPITHSRIHVIEGDAETAGKGWLLEVTCVPSAPPDVVEHLHKSWTETFTILSGIAYYSVAGVQKTASAGDSFTVLPGQRHMHPWNAGDVRLVYQQRNVFASPSAEAVQDTLGVLATNAVLAREGKIDGRGVAKNPLQLAATLRTLNKHGGYVTELPAGVQNAISATLGRLAEAIGYRGVYPRFVNEQK